MINKIENVQRKAAGFVFQGYRKESNVTNLKILKDLQLDMLEFWGGSKIKINIFHS